MPDHDTSNLPILDDIIQPGDADKAVRQPSSKVQTSMVTDQQQPEARADRTTMPSAGVPAGDSIPTVEPFSEALHGDNKGLAAAPASVAATTALRADRADATGSSAAEAGDRYTRSSTPDLDILTEEIMLGIKPEVERLLRRSIRKALEDYIKD